MRNNNDITIEPLDALLILKPDGTYEISLPDVAGDNVPDHLALAGALAYALQDGEIVDIIMANFDRECARRGTSATLSLFPGIKK